MRRPDWKLGKALSAATIVYLIFSTFGCALYMVLPPFFSSVGARLHAYVLIYAALDETGSVWPMVWTIVVHLYMLCMISFGIIALKNGRCRIYALLTAAEILMTAVFLLATDCVDNEFTMGILLNAAYCGWLIRKSLSQMTVTKTQTEGKDL